VMMRDLGFGFLQLGVLSAVSSLTGNGLQVVYGLLAGMFKRTTMLGLGNVVLGLSTILHSLVGNYPQLIFMRVVSSVGSSPQHPTGSSLLSRYYPKARGWALTFHYTAGNAGSFVAPALASFLLLYMGWRWVFVIFGIPGMLFGLALFFLRDRGPQGGLESKKTKAQAGLSAYVKCLKDRNLMLTSLILMVGAAGRGTGVNATYLVPFFMEQFSVSASSGGLLLTALQGAALVGPLTIGWLSDRYWKRSFIVQITLALSAIMTVWLPHHTGLDALFFVNLLLYGAVVNARGSLTQAMIADFASEELADAAFSIYFFVGFISAPIWTLVTGYIMDRYGFAPAFYVAACSYVAGMILLMFVKEKKR
jgi:MFS family permease